MGNDSKPVDVKVGQVWQDCDPRVKRKFNVVCISKDEATVQNTKTRRRTQIKLERFEKGSKKKGYKLVRDVAASAGQPITPTSIPMPVASSSCQPQREAKPCDTQPAPTPMPSSSPVQ